MLKPVWPNDIIKGSTTQALETSIAENRLGHGLLFIADSFEAADAAAKTVATTLLKSTIPHIDYLYAQPTNKQRQIGVESMRGLRDFLQKGSFSGVKVVHISQAERLQSSAANLFLKILEEPPQNSYIIMTTSFPHAVLPTLISRAMRFRFRQAKTSKDDKLEAWKMDFKKLLQKDETGGWGNIYFLIAEAFTLLSLQDETSAHKADPNEIFDKEVVEAHESAYQKMAQKKIFTSLEEVAIEFFKENPQESFHLTDALRAVERVYRLLDLNLNAAAAIESAIVGVDKALKCSL